MSPNFKPSKFALYLHIPFCGTRCTYCAFNTYTHAEALIPAYVEAMCRELRGLGRMQTIPIHTIYFGGGTPSLLTPAQVSQILSACRASFSVQAQVEITLEVNPGSIGSEYLGALRDVGVNRLSIGMQSAHSQELKLFARQHGVEAVVETVQDARCSGFQNISLDLIYGVPHQTIEMWHTSVEAALTLQPDHLSMYALGLESGTPMEKWVAKGRLPSPDDDLAADMYDLADHLVRGAGMSQYEISNWARPGFECAHNLQYWRNAPYLGVGAGAHGYADGIRYEIVRPIQQYIDLASQPNTAQAFPLTSTVEKFERVDLAGSMAEHMMTGLRLTGEGVSLSNFETRFGVPIQQIYSEQLAWLTQMGLLWQDGDMLRLTDRARLLSNQVFLQFMPD